MSSSDEHTFEKLEIEGWRQFEHVDILIHPRLTVITGANGSGKSTLLSLLSRHFGWNQTYLSTPIRDETGVTSYILGIIEDLWHAFPRVRSENNSTSIGKIYYSDGASTDLTVNKDNSPQYAVQIVSQKSVPGLHVDSYRPAPVYNVVPNISLSPMSAQVAYKNYNNEVINQRRGGHLQTSPILRMKEAIISMAVFGEGNSTIGRNQVIIDTFNGFNDILRKLLPDNLGFERLSIRSPDVVLVTRSGEFMIDASSGGIMTLIDIAWRIYMFSKDKSTFVVTMDEPENHLHPSMQRSLMRRLLDAFPDVQFIIATHSPFMVSSVKESNVYVLRYEARDAVGAAERVLHGTPVGILSASRVKSVQLTNVNKAANASEILREVLGVPATIPEWVEDSLEDLVKTFEGKAVTPDVLKELRQALSRIGYEEYFPEALSSFVKNSKIAP